jgi:predicted DNA-binding protein (UPF0251 family)
MNAYVSTELSMIQILDPQRHELALLQEAFLNKGGTIEVLQGPSFVPPPVRHEPPPKKKAAKAKPVTKPETPAWRDKLAQRDIEREERAIERSREKLELIKRIRKLAETMTYAQAIMSTGLSRRTLTNMAKANGFKFQRAAFKSQANLRCNVDEEKDAKDAERIKAFKELGLTRNQAREKAGISYRAFTRILENFDIDYPKSNARPAFFPRAPKQQE